MCLVSDAMMRSKVGSRRETERQAPSSKVMMHLSQRRKLS
jgi:hypothetical protein